MENQQAADTPLELYEKAYILHYQEYKIAEACSVYRELIDKFPDSQECGYAAVQLNKIESNKISKRLLQTETVSPRLSQASLIISIVSLVITISIIILFSIKTNYQAKQIIQSQEQIEKSIAKTSIDMNNSLRISRSLGALYAGNTDHALEILRNVQSTESKAIASYTITADIYLREKEYDKAIGEYEKLQKNFPNLEFISDKIAMIKKEREAAKDDSLKIGRRKAEYSYDYNPEPSFSPSRTSKTNHGYQKSLLVVDSVEFF